MSTDEYEFTLIDGGYRIGTLDADSGCSDMPYGFKSSATNKTPVSPSKYKGLYVIEIGRCAYGYRSERSNTLHSIDVLV